MKMTFCHLFILCQNFVKSKYHLFEFCYSFIMEAFDFPV